MDQLISKTCKNLVKLPVVSKLQSKTSRTDQNFGTNLVENENAKSATPEI